MSREQLSYLGDWIGIDQRLGWQGCAWLLSIQKHLHSPDYASAAVCSLSCHPAEPTLVITKILNYKHAERLLFPQAITPPHSS